MESSGEKNPSSVIAGKKQACLQQESARVYEVIFDFFPCIFCIDYDDLNINCSVRKSTWPVF